MFVKATVYVPEEQLVASPVHEQKLGKRYHFVKPNG